MIGESSRGTEARWTAGAAGCPEGVRARAERPNQLVPSSGQARLHRSYAWGLDASGTLTGAGGVGGLLLTSHHTPQSGGGTQVTTLAPLYDFNGNVLAYADVDTSTITHRMEYDPFGQELSLDTLLPGEGVAEAPRFRFSTKYTDGETGLVCYGFRYYSPELGRWPSRDPIGEKGGINLYGMVGNDAINTWDYLGLDNPVGPIPPMDRETKQKMFDDWYEGEKKKGNKWNDGLSACPCKIDGTKCPDPDKWENPSDSLHGYHKGASNCMRSKTAGGQPGEQCCYDKNGNLITSGTGAGSADKASPGSGIGDALHNVFSPSGHQAQDVRPYDMARDLDGGDTGPNIDKYNEVRPSNNKNNCPKNHVDG